MSLIDDMAKTMTTAQIYNKLRHNVENLTNELMICSVGNRLSIMDLMSKAYKERYELERNEVSDKDIIEELQGASGV